MYQERQKIYIYFLRLNHLAFFFIWPTFYILKMSLIMEFIGTENRSGLQGRNWRYAVVNILLLDLFMLTTPSLIVLSMPNSSHSSSLWSNTNTLKSALKLRQDNIHWIKLSTFTTVWKFSVEKKLLLILHIMNWKAVK